MHPLITSFCMLLTKLKSMKIVLPKTCNVMPLMYIGDHSIYDVIIVMLTTITLDEWKHLNRM